MVDVQEFCWIPCGLDFRTFAVGAHWPTEAGAGLDTMRKSGSRVSHAVKALGVLPPLFKIVVPWPAPELLTATMSSQNFSASPGCPGGTRVSSPGVFSVLDHPEGTVISSPGKTVPGPSR